MAKIDLEVAPMSGAVSGHKGRDRWMRALAVASDLSTMAVRLALLLAVFFNCKTGRCDPGYRTLAEAMAVSERSVFRAIAELEAGGWIAVDRTGGDNTRNNQINLLIPSAQVTTVVTRSGDNMESPETVPIQVTENGGSGDRNTAFRVTHSVAAQKNLKPEEPQGRGLTAPRTVRVVRESASSSPTVDDASPIQRAAEAALIDTVAAQQQPPSRDCSETGIGTAASGAHGGDAIRAAFEDATRDYPSDCIGSKKAALNAFCAAVARRGLSVVIGRIQSVPLEHDAEDMPMLADALTYIEHGC